MTFGPRKQLLLKLGVFLLLGAIMNVAVAWGCGVWSPTRVREFSAPEKSVVATMTMAGFGVSLFASSHPEVNGQSLSCGWPATSFRDPPIGANKWEHVAQVPEWIPLRKRTFVPVAPLWPGFAINTMFYAAMLWALWIAPGRIRRYMILRRRIKRHQCPACAYPVGTSPVCTECGHALSLRRSAGM